MRTHLRSRLAPLALVAAATALAACFDQELPTTQVGGTEYGLQLTVPSPVRVPTAAFQGRFVAAAPRRLDSLWVTLSNFELLYGPSTRAAYRFYAVTRSGAATPVTARLFRVRTDTIIKDDGRDSTRADTSLMGVSTFVRGTPNNSTILARFAGPQFGDSNTAYLVVTIQADSNAPAWESAPKPVWARYRSLVGSDTLAAYYNVLATGTSSFGNFHHQTPFIFTPLGRGRSAFWDRNRDGRLLFSAIAENLTQPPIGYYYQPWLRDTRVRRAVRFGDIFDPAGNSLRDADLTPIASVAQLPTVRFRTSDDSLGLPMNTFEAVHLVLEPKLGTDTAFALTSILVGTIGDTLGFRGTGALRVSVVRTGQPVGNVRVIVTSAEGPYLVGRGNAAPTDDVRGEVLVDRIPEGLVNVRVVPPTGMTAPAAPTQVTVVRRDTTAVTVTLP